MVIARIWSSRSSADCRCICIAILGTVRHKGLDVVNSRPSSASNMLMKERVGGRKEERDDQHVANRIDDKRNYYYYFSSNNRFPASDCSCWNYSKSVRCVINLVSVWIMCRCSGLSKLSAPLPGTGCQAPSHNEKPSRPIGSNRLAWPFLYCFRSLL